MFRNIDNSLIKWKNSKNRKPLLIRGARQVGKSYAAESLGRHYFANCITINFELEPRYISCFDNLDPAHIVRAIEVIAQQDITAGQTLLFLDEIQYCPNAIVALRYFKEKMPDLHVIGAGSFLEFVINDDQLQQPVGRVESLYMYPCSFQEFLLARGDTRLVEYLKLATLKTGIEAAIHDLLLERLRDFFITGGMPEVVQHFIDNKKFLGCEKIQATILEYYQRDFSKYHKKLNHHILEKIFKKAPGLVAQHFKYVDIDPETKAREQKPCFDALIKAGLLHPIYLTKANGLPFTVGMNEKKFKLLFLDVGLVNHATGLNAETLLHEHLIQLNKGNVAEQFVGQELIAYHHDYEKSQLYYWEREKAGSQAEVDYLFNQGSKIFPLEVKAGKTGRLKSLQIFLDEKKLDCGVRISQSQLGFEQRVLSVPLYIISELPRLLKDMV